MIRLTPTFITNYHNTSNGLPEGIDTTLTIPEVKLTGKKAAATYIDRSYLKNPVFPAELYEYRRGKNMKLSIDGEVLSLFAEKNLAKNIYEKQRHEDQSIKPC